MQAADPRGAIPGTGEGIRRRHGGLNKLGEKAKTQAERQAIYKDHRLPEKEFNPRFLALAERYPNDPVAVDALVWIVEKTMRYWDGYDRAMGETIGRTMEILARDHLGDARLGALCLKLVYYPSPRRDVFLRAVAERSPDRVVRGRATLALAQYLKMKGEFVESLKKPAGDDGGYGRRRLRATDVRSGVPGTAPRRRSGPMLREADQLFARVFDDYGDIAFTPPTVSPRGRPSPTSPIASGRPGPVADPGEQFRTHGGCFQRRGQGRQPGRGRGAEEGGQGRAGRGEHASLHRGLSQMA